MARTAPIATVLLLASVATCSWLQAADASTPAAAGSGLRVSGSRLLDGRGRRLELRGVNRSGTEYACIQGWGLFDGPSGPRSVKAMASWHMNFVRVPLNEDCWLGINGVNHAYGGATYRRAILKYVKLLHRYGMYAELSLIWAAPGRYEATYQSGAPDEDHSPAMWASLASTFERDRNVVLAPWGETVVDARASSGAGCARRPTDPRTSPTGPQGCGRLFG
jgi:hypothetical protein